MPLIADKKDLIFPEYVLNAYNNSHFLACELNSTGKEDTRSFGRWPGPSFQRGKNDVGVGYQLNKGVIGHRTPK